MFEVSFYGGALIQAISPEEAEEVLTTIMKDQFDLCGFNIIGSKEHLEQ